MHQALEILRRMAGAFENPHSVPEARELFRAFRQVHDALGGRPSSIIDAILRVSSEPGFGPDPQLVAGMIATQFRIFGADVIRSRGLVERLAMQGGYEQSFAMLLDGLAALARTPAEIEDEIGELGRYTLHRRIACSPPEECFAATIDDRDGEVFLRTFPRERLTDEVTAYHRSRARLEVDGIARLHDFGVVEHRPYVASELIPGIDLRGLDRTSVPMALALLAEGLQTLDAIHAREELHGHLTPSRIRIEPLGKVVLCFGGFEIPSTATRGEDLCTLARLILANAAGDPQLIEVLATNDEEAMVVAADRLVELHPELDDLVPAILWNRTQEDLVPLLAPHVARDEALRLIGTLIEAART